MNIPHPLQFDRDALAEAGFQLDFSPRERGNMDEVLSWPLSWVPLAPYAPQLIRIPSQAIPLTCAELRGNIIGSEGETQIIEVAEVYLPGDLPTLTGPGTILHFDIPTQNAPEWAEEPEPIIRLRQQQPNGLRPLPTRLATSGADLLGTATHRPRPRNGHRWLLRR